MKKRLHFQLLLLTALIFNFVFTAEKSQAAKSDESKNIYKLLSISGVDISSLGITEEMMTVTISPDGTGTMNWEGAGADFIYRKLDENNISINIEGDELLGTMNGDTLSLSIDGADFVLVKDPPEIVEEDKPSALSNLFGTLWSALIGEKKEQEPDPTPTEIPQPTAVPVVEPTKESVPSGFKDKLTNLINTVRESQPIVQEEQIITDEAKSAEENNSSGSKDKWIELANAVRESQNSEQNEQPTAVVPQPTAAPTTIPTDQPKDPSPTPQGLLPASFKVGDTFTFGRYEQDNKKTTRPEPIEWQVLAVEDNSVLIISKYGLDQVSYNSENADVSWETCSLRTWLNDEFINTAFNAEEQSKIAWVTNKNPSDLTSGTKIFTTEPQPDGNDTLDRVFLMSIDEVNRYFPTDEARECEPTEYAEEKGVMTTWLNPPFGKCGWWLRTRVGYIMEAGNRGYYAAEAHIFGIGESPVWSFMPAVRPALWLNISGTTGTGQDSQTKVSTQNTEAALPKSFRKGETIIFGHYEQDNNTANGPEPIEWQVLTVENGRPLMISKFGLDQVPYNTENTDVTWENSSLRAWLNEQFFRIAFSEEEQSKISWTTNKNPGDPTFMNSGNPSVVKSAPDSNDTADRIFLLSKDEANKYFSSDKARVCQATAYAKANGVQNPSWWLRTRVGSLREAGEISYQAGEVYANGLLGNIHVTYSHEAVRPAFWLDPSGTAGSTKTELKRPEAVYTEPTKPAQTSASADDGRYIDSCRMKSYLKPGDHAEVVTERGLKMRKKPAGSEIGVQAFRGKDVKILDGPTCVNGYVWFEIDFLGYRGWSMEGKDGIYYLRKTNGTPTNPDPSGRRSNPRPTAVPSNSNTSDRSMNQSKLKIGDTVNIINTSGLQMFFNPAGKAMADKQAFPGKTAKITDGPKIIDGVIWWEIDFLGYRGWVTEFVPPRNYYLEKK